ncbi:MAG: AgmX/PglI C-terminal domain-containing protein [bacterium]|nr:AgmX/PglI C-terminal domain-containing protein [bacterium]
MSVNAMGFPRELEHQLWRDTDKELIVISIVAYVVTIGFYGIMSALGMQYTLEHAQKKLDQLYQVKPAVIAQRQAARKEQPKEEGRQEETERTKEIASRTTEKKEMSAAERSARRQSEAGARERSAGAAVAAAQSVGIFKQAGVKGGIGGGGRGGGAVEGLSTGAGAGVDANKLSGLGVSGSDLAGAKKLRAGGALIEGGGGTGGRLNLSSMSSADIENLIKRASVKVTGAPSLSGSEKAKGASARSAGAISGKVSGYGVNVKACYQQFLRQDPNLAGTVRFAFTIKANGTVSGVKITDSDWTDTALGRRVEGCIRERVQSWKFDQIEAASGDLTVNYSYVFSR